MKATIIILSLSILFAFSDTNKIESKQNYVYLITFGNVESETLLCVSNVLTSFYGYKCIIDSTKNINPILLKKYDNKYNASEILKKYKSDKQTIIITEEDICIKKKRYGFWGVVGLAYINGNTSIISTNRLKNKTSIDMFYSRIKKVAIHEIGHNKGLYHCTNSECLMNDAKGKMSSVDKKQLNLCLTCKNKIK